MKFRKTKNKILYLSRQSDVKSQDMLMLEGGVKKVSPETQQVFRLKRLKDESAISLSYIFSIFGDMWEMASAKVVIADTYSIPVSCLNHKKETKIIQIWHAMGAVKQFSLQAAGKAQGRDSGVAKAMSMHKNYDFVISPSEKTAEFYCEAFGCSKDKIVIASLPRVDVISDGKSRYDEFIELNPEYKNKKLIAYFPTFRDNDSVYIKALSDSFRNNENYALIVSPHPATKVSEEYAFNGKFSTYDLGKLSYGIISDYSATAIECSLLNKPLWFYVPDYEQYKAEKGLNIEIKDEFSKASFEDENELLEAVQNGSYDFDNLKRFSDKYIKNKGTDNTSKLAGVICEQLR